MYIVGDYSDGSITIYQEQMLKMKTIKLQIQALIFVKEMLIMN